VKWTGTGMTGESDSGRQGYGKSGVRQRGWWWWWRWRDRWRCGWSWILCRICRTGKNRTLWHGTTWCGWGSRVLSGTWRQFTVLD